MSLTGLLKSNIREADELREIISIINIDIDKISKGIMGSEIKAKYLLRNHNLASQVGTAFDYLARFVLKHYQKKVGGTAYHEQYVAKYGLMALLHYTENKENNYQLVYDAGLDVIDKYINGDDSDELFTRLIGVSVYFAKLERIYRNGYSPERENDLKYRIDRYVEQELRNQIAIFKDTFEDKFGIATKRNTIFYNPHFGHCSMAVGGADADIIINDVLIDFKSSKYLKGIEEDFKQIVGYYLFTKVINAPTNINKICLYFSRYGKFVEYEFTKEDKKNIDKATKKMTNYINNLDLF